MLKLKKLEVEGFGPFADRQILDFPGESGVTVVYGENMRGKTSLLNAIRFAFFETVRGRGNRSRRLHTVTNRALAAEGHYGFEVALAFEHNEDDYELVRQCVPLTEKPTSDEDYQIEALLRRGDTVLGPQERNRVLQQIFPKEVSRFFLFDGELLQEYEELLINESEAGHRISEAIERILGVPVLKRGRAHLTQLSDEADKLAAREASKHQETEALGNALQQATAQKEAHQEELSRLRDQLQELNTQRSEIEQFLQSKRKYASLLQEKDEATDRLKAARSAQSEARRELARTMANSWRTLLRAPIKEARAKVEVETGEVLESVQVALKARAAASGHCGTCDQDLTDSTVKQLESQLPPEATQNEVWTPGDLAESLSRLRDLNKFDDADYTPSVRQLWSRIRELEVEIAGFQDRISDLSSALTDSNPDSIRRERASYSEVTEKIAAVKQAIAKEEENIAEKDQNIQRIKKKLEASGASDLKAVQARANLLRGAAEVFDAAVEEYKNQLRARVEETASDLFLKITTEEEDYDSLAINENYGLTIIHRDGRAEEARSAGAEHVVALALMGALQSNAPLRGPIVMDSPFGRLDEGHTGKVIKALPVMAEQVVLLVYESEVGKDRVRRLLGGSLLREYELERVSARRTNIREVQ